MKIRNGFVSNSSSSSFMIKNVNEKIYNLIKDQVSVAKQIKGFYDEDETYIPSNNEAWNINEHKNKNGTYNLSLNTSMDNFDLYKLVNILGVKDISDIDSDNIHRGIDQDYPNITFNENEIVINNIVKYINNENLLEYIEKVGLIYTDWDKNIDMIKTYKSIKNIEFHISDGEISVWSTNKDFKYLGMVKMENFQKFILPKKRKEKLKKL